MKKKQGVILNQLSFQYILKLTLRDKALKILYITNQNELEAVCKHRRFLESVGMTINKRGIIYLRNWMNTMQNK